MRLAAFSTGMPPPKHPHWPSDDQVREQANDREFTDDGRKLTESGRVGGLAPDADPEPPHGPHRPRRR
jgi:hypothetical protein